MRFTSLSELIITYNSDFVKCGGFYEYIKGGDCFVFYR